MLRNWLIIEVKYNNIIYHIINHIGEHAKVGAKPPDRDQFQHYQTPYWDTNVGKDSVNHHPIP